MPRLIAPIIGALAALAGSSLAAQDQKPVVSQNLELRVVAITRAPEWLDPRFPNPPGGGPGFKAKEGHEVAIVRLAIERLKPDARVSLKEIYAYDSAGNKHKSPVVGQDDLGESAEETRELAFVVPKGAELTKIQLAQDLVIELK